MELRKTLILLVIMAITFGGLSLTSVTDAHHYEDSNTTNETNETPDVSPTPYEEQNTTPNVSPTPEISVSPTPEISETPTPTPTEAITPTPTQTPQGGGEEHHESSGGSSSPSTPQVIAATTYAPTGNALVNIFLGLGLSLLTFGGVTYAKRNIS